MKKKCLTLSIFLLCSCNMNNSTNSETDNTLEHSDYLNSITESNEDINTNSDSEKTLNYSDCFDSISVNNADSRLNLPDNIVLNKEINQIYRQLYYEIKLKQALTNIEYDNEYFEVKTKDSNCVSIKALNNDFERKDIIFTFENGQYDMSFYTGDEDKFTVCFYLCYTKEYGKCFYFVDDKGTIDVERYGPFLFDEIQSEISKWSNNSIYLNDLDYGSEIQIHYYSSEWIIPAECPFRFGLTHVIYSIDINQNGRIIELTVGSDKKLFDSSNNEYTLIGRTYIVSDNEIEFDDLKENDKVYAYTNDAIGNNKICYLSAEYE